MRVAADIQREIAAMNRILPDGGRCALQDKLDHAGIFGDVDYRSDELLIPDFRVPVDTSLRCGVYFLFRDDCLIYIGQSKNIGSRIGQHVATGFGFDAYSFIECMPHRLNELEAVYTLKFKPDMNVHEDGRPTHSSVVGALKRVRLDGGKAFRLVPKRTERNGRMVNDFGNAPKVAS